MATRPQRAQTHHTHESNKHQTLHSLIELRIIMKCKLPRVWAFQPVSTIMAKVGTIMENARIWLAHRGILIKGNCSVRLCLAKGLILCSCNSQRPTAFTISSAFPTYLPQTEPWLSHSFHHNDLDVFSFISYSLDFYISRIMLDHLLLLHSEKTLSAHGCTL